jgi:hypothetical protein
MAKRKLQSKVRKDKRRTGLPRTRRGYFLLILFLAILGLGGVGLAASQGVGDEFLFADFPAVHQDDDVKPGSHSAESELSNQTAPAFQGPWIITKPANSHEIEGYTTLASAKPGQEIGFAISCKADSFSADIFRMGWYNGDGGHLVDQVPPTGCSERNASPMNPHTGLINLYWPVTFHLNIPTTWQSGYYLARLTSDKGYQSFVPFLVQSASPQNPILFIHATATDAAYNNWGGNSLYAGNTPDLHIPRAAKVSLNRPFAINDGAGNFLTWEYPMVRFLDRANYNVDYASDLDINKNPSLLLKYKSVVIAGHDEYWTLAMRNGYETAVKKGVNLAIFAANTSFRPTRYEADPDTGQPGRVIVCYKDYLLDPDWSTDPPNVTAYSWRAYPHLWSESNLLGEVYKGETDGPQPLTVGDADSWILNRTGLVKGVTLPGLVGYEYDEFVPPAPHPNNIDIIFKSKIRDATGTMHMADATYYKLPSGGQVFNAGTIQWSWGLDPALKTYSPALVKTTQNILDRFTGN